MDTAIAKQLVDKMYEKRKAAALDLEKLVRDCHQQGDERRICQIVDQLIDMFTGVANALHVRNGGLIGLAGTAIALGVDIAPYIDKFLDPLLSCFTDPENRVRYFSAECLYNIAKVSKGEVLVYFNPIFDALSKLAADSELSVKNGAELLDRLLKDIVAESASFYVPQYPETEKARIRADERDADLGIVVPHPDDLDSADQPGAKRAFSLARFIPLLSDRIYVLSPFTRSFLVSWITVLDSVPELELITYLPEFLDGLLKYLSDPNEDVRIAAENQLGEFLREIREVTVVRKHNEEQEVRLQERDEQEVRSDGGGEKEKPAALDVSLAVADSTSFLNHNDALSEKGDAVSDIDERDTGAWLPGQGVRIDYAAIIEILIRQLDSQHDEIQQSTALQWLAEFVTFAPEVIIPFIPRLIPAILPNLAHHVPMIQASAIRTNKLLTNVVQSLPVPPTSEPPTRQTTNIASSTNERPNSSRSINVPPSPVHNSPAPPRQPTLPPQSQPRDVHSPEPALTDSTIVPSTTNTQPPGNLTLQKRNSLQNEAAAGTPRPLVPINVDAAQQSQSAGQNMNVTRTHSPTSMRSGHQDRDRERDRERERAEEFDYQATVNALTIQFLSEHEETRVAALKWLIMLHQKAPKKILAMDDGTFPALLKTLSDSSEEVIKHDLQLLAQISSSSEESYFKAFMMNLLELFSTDRRLLDTRGSLIIRQLCLNLNTERIYKAFAEILEKEEDLEFASVIVQKLNMILITSPELADFRKRLKSLETRQDGQALFVTLYRSWCHNAVSVFSLCLLAQAYEHASNLLSIFADLEITVPLLVQIDKLVQLIESPVFTYIRLQLLEPDRYPYLFKCLYGLLMILPQSTAFVSLRNRLNAVNSAGFLHIAPKPTVASMSSTRSKLARDEIKWPELLSHFRSVQARHEKARRVALGTSLDVSSFNANSVPSISLSSGQSDGDRDGRSGSRPQMRRRVTGQGGEPPGGGGVGSGSGQGIPPGGRPPSRSGALSPLNPRARVSGGLLASALSGQNQNGVKTKRGLSLSRKS